MIDVIYDSNKMKLISCGDYFIVECEKRKRLYGDRLKDGWEEGAIGYCHHKLSFKEVLEYLPQINEYIHKDLKVEISAHQLSLVEKSDIEGKLWCNVYKLFIGKNCILEKNTLKDGSVYAVRDMLISYIAHLVFDYTVLKIK